MTTSQLVVILITIALTTRFVVLAISKNTDALKDLTQEVRAWRIDNDHNRTSQRTHQTHTR